MHGTEGALFQLGIAALEFVDQVFDLLALGIAVSGTRIVDHGQLEALGGVADKIFSAVEQGADLGDVGAAEIGDGLKAGQPPLENKGHVKGLHGIVIVVAQGDLPNASLLHGLMQGTPAELGAQRAGVLLLLDIEDHVVDVALQQGVGYA